MMVAVWVSVRSVSENANAPWVEMRVRRRTVECRRGLVFDNGAARAARSVDHEHVGRAAVGIVRHDKIARGAAERQERSAGANIGSQRAFAIAQSAVRSDRNKLEGLGLQVVDEGVAMIVGVARNQVGGRAREDHERPLPLIEARSLSSLASKPE